MVRGRDACWEHCVLVDATRQKVRCNYCHREFSGGVYRMKFHLAQIRNKDIVPCPQVPNIVRDHIQSILTAPKRHKASEKAKTNRATNSSSSASSGLHPNHASSGPQDSLCHLKTPELLDDSQKQKQESADKKIAAFFYQNLVAVSSAKSMSYLEMFGSAAECGPGYKPPSYQNLRSTLLEKAKVDLHDLYAKHRDYWKESGCTILCDSRAESYVVFSVACPKGTLFLKSVVVSGHEDNSSYLFELIESVVLEVGVENVVQVITDSEPVYVFAGQHLMAKYSSLLWSPCASDCVNKMLEDIGRQEQIATVLDEANAIATFIYSQPGTLNMMKKFASGKELTRPRINSFVSKYLCLRAVVNQKKNLIHLFSNSKWLNPEAQALKSLLFQDRFWKDAHEALRISEGLITILRMVDGDMPAMGYIYEGFERAKAAIKAFYKGMAEKYMPIWEIIDRRWDQHLPLHSAAAFLNPSIFYSPNVRLDPRVRNGFQEVVMKMATSDEDKIEITKEHPVYINGQGALGTDFAVMGRTLNSPGDWWAGFGYEIPSLHRVAMRILSQPCSLHWCRWNWSTFESLHTKKRRKGEMEKLNDLVFVHCNLWLRGIWQSKDGKCKPVVFDEIDVDSDWFTEMEPSAPVLNDSWLDNLPFEIGTALELVNHYC